MIRSACPAMTAAAVAVSKPQTSHRRNRSCGATREVAHLMRVSVMGELSGAIAHEINQPREK